MKSDHRFDPAPPHQTQTLLACLEIGKRLTSTFDLKEILRLIMEKVSELVEAQNWSLLLVDEPSGELIFEVVVGNEGEVLQGVRLPSGKGVAGHVCRTGEMVFLPDARSHARFNPDMDAMTGFTTESLIALPLKINDTVLGVIEILNVRDLSFFESRLLPALSILADYAAIALWNSQLFGRIQKMSITDEYTGLYNARYLHQVVKEMLDNPAKAGDPFAVCFIDVDNFKQVVDRFGHLGGSRVLKEIGVTIRSCLSEKDILIKYGGDEYVIVFPGKSKEAAIRTVKGILQAVREATYLELEPVPVKVTASMGIAAYPEDAAIKKDLLLIADQAMYSVKRTTKDNIGTL